MEIVARKLREKSGEVAVDLCFDFLALFFIFIVLLNIRQAFQTVDRVIDRTNEAVLAVAAINGPGALGGVREGEAVSRNYNGASWGRVVTTQEVLYTLSSSLGATISGQSLSREGSFRIDHLSTSCVNFDGGVLHFVSTMDLTISLLGGDDLTITIPLEVKTTYEAKF